MKSAIIRVAITLVIMGSLFSYARAAAGPTRYAVTHLRQVANAVGGYASVNTINDNGLAVGNDIVLTSEQFAGQQARGRTPLLWDAAGTPTALAKPANSPYVMAAAINNNGLIVGTAETSTTFGQPTRAAILGSATSSLIPLDFSGSRSRATDVNDAGTIALVESGRAATFKNNTKTFLGGSLSAYATLLNANDATFATGTINGSGTPRPYKLTPTSSTPLYSDTTRPGDVYDVNRAEKAVGRIAAGGGQIGGLAALFANGQVTTLSGLSTFAAAFSINDRDVIVGTSSPSSSALSRAFRAIGGTTVDLNALLPAGSGWTLQEALGINNRGEIVGNGLFDDDQNASTAALKAPFRLDPIRRAGDTNYDDAINFADLVILAQSYNKSGNGTVFWETGDFNYDWKVDFADLVILAQNYNHAASLAADWALAQSLVPEPTSPVLISIAAAALCRRRRR
jgi:hypothetical protein